MLEKFRKIMIMIMIASMLFELKNMMNALYLERVHRLYSGVYSETFYSLLIETGNVGDVIPDTTARDALLEKSDAFIKNKENLYMLYLI